MNMKSSFIHEYLIYSLQDPGGLFFHTSYLAPDDLKQFGEKLIQLCKELRLQRYSCNPHELCIDLGNKNKECNKTSESLNVSPLKGGFFSLDTSKVGCINQIIPPKN